MVPDPFNPPLFPLFPASPSGVFLHDFCHTPKAKPLGVRRDEGLVLEIQRGRGPDYGRDAVEEDDGVV